MKNSNYTIGNVKEGDLINGL